jgi:hypothetical protein
MKPWKVRGMYNGTCLHYLHQRITIEQSYNTISRLFFDAESNGEVGGSTPTDVCATTSAAVVLCNL